MTEKNTSNNQHLITEWCRITIERFNEAIDKHGIGISGDLKSSIVSSIIAGSDGNIAAIELKFLYYGRFVDMGVGKGVPIGSASGKADYFNFRSAGGQLHNYNRQAKPWYSPKKVREISRLEAILAQFYGYKTINVFESTIDNTTAVIKL